MKNFAQAAMMASAAFAASLGASNLAEAQAPRQGNTEFASFNLDNRTTAHMTLSIVNQGLSVPVPARTNGVVRSSPFYLPNTDSTGFYRIRVANTSTGAVSCEGVAQMKWTQSSQSVQCLAPDMGRCSMYGRMVNGYCVFQITAR